MLMFTMIFMTRFSLLSGLIYKAYRVISIKRFFFLAGMLLTGTGFFLFSACDEPGIAGIELLPSTDLINAHNVIEKETIRAYAYIDDSLRTDESSTSLLGMFNDPVFGKTTADLALQFRLKSFPDWGSNPVPDSILFYFYYRTIYGDTSSVQKLEIYELAEPLDPDANYYHDVDLQAKAASFKLADFDFKPSVKLDTTYQDTMYQLVGVRLDPSLAQKLISADSLDLVNNESFLEYFRGLYIKPVSAGGQGSLVSLSLLGSSTMSASAVVLYYHNDEDTTNMAFYVTDFSARVNSFKHDYTTTAFYPYLNQESHSDSLLYIQSTGGLQSKVYLPFLEGWKDSSRIAINKAELIFTIDTTASNYRKYPLPTQLFLTYINDDGQEYLPKDYSFLPAYYGGYLYGDYTYRFNITQHMQSIMEGETENHGFFLTPNNKNSEMRRAVLKGTSSAAGVKMVITYSKFNQ